MWQISRPPCEWCEFGQVYKLPYSLRSQGDKEELKQAVRTIKTQLKSYEYDRSRMITGIVSLTIEMDIKAMIRHIHLLLSATLNKQTLRISKIEGIAYIYIAP